MAISKSTSPIQRRDGEPAEPQPLSGFQLRCLVKRISELHELAQLAVLGADQARDQAQADDLVSICMALHLAELQIAFAEGLAARQVH